MRRARISDTAFIQIQHQSFILSEVKSCETGFQLLSEKWLRFEVKKSVKLMILRVKLRILRKEQRVHLSALCDD